MFIVVRASRELMNEVMACINSNSHLYEGIVDPQDWSEHSVNEEWAEHNFQIREFYLARDHGDYIGEALYQNFGSFAYIGYFYIKNQFLRQGYGFHLMRFMEMRTLTDNITDLRLFCNPNSAWAVDFYSKNGFQILSSDKDEILAMENGVMQPFYEENSYFMQKILEPPKPLTLNHENFEDINENPTGSE